MISVKKILPLWMVLTLNLWLPSALGQQPPTSNPQPLTPIVQAVDAVGMTVADMEHSLEFYTNVLSFEKVSDVEVWGPEYEHLQGIFGLRMRGVRLRLGKEDIELTEYLAPKGRLSPVDSRSNDYWFQHVAIIVRDMDRTYQWLRQHKVQHASTGPQRLPDWNPNAGARLRITSLRAAPGPGIKFLEYLAPQDGRLFPDDVQANDLLHWQTKLVIHNPEVASQQVRAGDYRLVSPGVVTIPQNQLGFQKAVTVGNPDGHVMQLVEK